MMLERPKKQTDYLLQWKFYETYLASKGKEKEGGGAITSSNYFMKMFAERPC